MTNEQNNKRWIPEIRLSGARMVYKHFSGEKDEFHAPGQMDFAVIIEDLDYARELEAQGWNIKYPKPNPEIDPEEDSRRPTLKVKVAFDNTPPDVWTILKDENGEDIRRKLNHETVHRLDTLRFSNIDMLIVPYNWTHQSRTGVSAYLSQFYGTIEPVGFESKYGF